MAQAVDLCRTAAQSRYEKALPWHQSLFVIREQVCLAILVDAEQANELGGSVRKGEQSTVIVFWKIDQKEGERTTPETKKPSAGFFCAITAFSISNNATCRKPGSTNCRRSRRTSTIRSTQLN